jgi:hypothetical protein
MPRRKHAEIGDSKNEEEEKDEEVKEVVIEEEKITDFNVINHEVFTVQEILTVNVLGIPEQFFVTRPVSTVLYRKLPIVLVGTTPIVICPSPKLDGNFKCFADCFPTHEGKPFPPQEIVSDGRAHFYVTRPCHTTANEHHVTIHCVRPVYLFTTRQAAEVYIKLNYAEFGASADFSCEYTHKCKDIYLVTVN